MFKLTNNIYKMSFTYPCPRKLREIMKMSLIQRQPAHTIKDIWKQYHQSRANNTADVIDKDKYQHLMNKANHSPMFLIPIHRGNGHFKLLTQWQDNCFLCTYLEDFKRNGKNAPPYLVITFFTQLLFNKGITLVRSDILNNSLTKNQAQITWQNIQQSYLEQQKYDLVNKFNHAQQHFSMEKYNELYYCQ